MMALEHKPTFVPSVYQEKVFDFVKNGEGHGVIGAVAGSGKTSTLVEVAKLLKGEKALFVAFNARIVKELGSRLAGTGMDTQTTYSIGFSCLREALGNLGGLDSYASKNKYRALVKEWVGGGLAKKGVKEDLARRWSDQLLELVNFARLTITDPNDKEALLEMASHFGVEVDPDVETKLLKGVATILNRGAKIAQDKKVIDFTDMVYLPHRFNLVPRSRYARVLVDECQDLSRAQLELAKKCLAPGGRMLFVGDANQAIYGFSGADPQAFHNIVTDLKATVLPLSICYRCPVDVIKLAGTVVPSIEARPGAPSGTVLEIEEGDFVKAVKPGDMVLCRLNAPMLKWCIDLIAQRIPARVEGREIHTQITQLAEQVGQLPGFSYDKMGTWLNAYVDLQVSKLARRKDAESQIERLRDRAEALRACFSAYDEATSVGELIQEIKGLFADRSGCVVFSTIHRAKGGEWARVFILRPDKLPLSHPKQQDWEKVQEQNLYYVAVTRSTDTLIFINHEKKGEEDGDGE